MTAPHHPRHVDGRQLGVMRGMKEQTMTRWLGMALVMMTLAGCGGAVGELRETAENRDLGFQPTRRWDPGFQPTRRMAMEGVAHAEGITHHGNCFVLTDIDALTDKERHSLACGHHESRASVALLGGDKPAVAFSVESMIHFEPLISVAYRIDKGEVRRGQWLSYDNHALTSDRDVFDRLLAELPAAKRIVIQVGNEQAIIPLNGSAVAVKDFKSRTALPEYKR